MRTVRTAGGLIIEADCLAALPLLETGSVDLIFCDLPFGTTQSKWDSVIPLAPLWDEYWRVLKENGAVVLFSQGVFTAQLIISCEEYFKYRLTWVKSKATNFLNAKRQPLRKMEDICVFYRRQPTYNPQMGEGAAYNKGVRKNQQTGSYGTFNPVEVASSGGRYPTDVIYFPTAESEGTVWHPTQKPVALCEYIISTYSDPGDIVLDNCFGSGSILVAADNLGRRFVGIERNEQVSRASGASIDCLDVTRQRLEGEAC